MTRSPAFERYARDSTLVLGRRGGHPAAGRRPGGRRAASPRTARSPTTRCGGCGTRSATSTRSASATPQQVRRAAGFVDRAHAGRAGRDRSGPAALGRGDPVPGRRRRARTGARPARRRPRRRDLRGERAARHGAAGSGGALARRPRPRSTAIGWMPWRPSRSATMRGGGPRSAAPASRPAVGAGRHAARPHPHRGSAPGIRSRRVRAAVAPARVRRAVRVARLAARLTPRRLRARPARSRLPVDRSAERPFCQSMRRLVGDALD